MLLLSLGIAVVDEFMVNWCLTRLVGPIAGDTCVGTGRRWLHWSDRSVVLSVAGGLHHPVTTCTPVATDVTSLKFQKADVCKCELKDFASKACWARN